MFICILSRSGSTGYLAEVGCDDTKCLIYRADSIRKKNKKVFKIIVYCVSGCWVYRSSFTLRVSRMYWRPERQRLYTRGCLFTEIEQKFVAVVSKQFEQRSEVHIHIFESLPHKYLIDTPGHGFELHKLFNHCSHPSGQSRAQQFVRSDRLSNFVPTVVNKSWNSLTLKLLAPSYNTLFLTTFFCISTLLWSPIKLQSVQSELRGNLGKSISYFRTEVDIPTFFCLFTMSFQGIPQICCNILGNIRNWYLCASCYSMLSNLSSGY